MSKKNEVMSVEDLAVLDNAYPVVEESNRLNLPRFGMLSKDIVEESGKGKNKTIKVIEAAGTFFVEKDNGEVDPKTGKKVWAKEFIGDKADVIIAFERKQLRKFDSSLEKFISSPIYDNGEQIIPLYLDKQIIKRGTAKELQALYPKLTQKGKPSSDLKEETILYVIYSGELHQCTLTQSSKWAFKDYKKSLNPDNPTKVLTSLGSVEETFGENTYSKMTFAKSRYITKDELDIVLESNSLLKEKAEADNKYFLANVNAPALGSGDDELDEIANSGSQDFK